MTEKLYLVKATGETGLNTGRRRYYVQCTACMQVIHEATTGPEQRMRDHDAEDCEESRREAWYTEVVRTRNAKQTTPIPETETEER